MGRKPPDYTIFDSGGKLTTSHIQVSKDGIRPPH